MADHIHHQRYHGLAEVDQHRVGIATELLRVDLLGIETELSAQFQQLAQKPVPDEILGQIRELHRLMRNITFEQGSATFAMTGNQLQTADTLQKQATENFQRAEELFDRIRRAVAAALDEFEVQNPNIADLRDPKLDEFLTQLEREPNIEAQLGLPDRPRNLRIIADSMEWQQQGGQQLGEAEEAANARSKSEMKMRNEKGEPNQEPQQKPQTEMTEQEREQREQDRKKDEDLAKALVALKERLKDPSEKPADKEKLEQLARDLQDKLQQTDPDKASDELLEQMQKDLVETVSELQKRASRKIHRPRPPNEKNWRK